MPVEQHAQAFLTIGEKEPPVPRWSDRDPRHHLQALVEFTATKFEEGCFWKTKRINGSSFEHRDIALRGNEQVWPNELATVVDVASRDAGESQPGSDPSRSIVIGGRVFEPCFHDAAGHVDHERGGLFTRPLPAPSRALERHPVVVQHAGSHDLRRDRPGIGRRPGRERLDLRWTDAVDE